MKGSYDVHVANDLQPPNEASRSLTLDSTASRCILKQDVFSFFSGTFSLAGFRVKGLGLVRHHSASCPAGFDLLVASRKSR